MKATLPDPVEPLSLRTKVCWALRKASWLVGGKGGEDEESACAASTMRRDAEGVAGMLDLHNMPHAEPGSLFNELFCM